MSGTKERLIELGKEVRRAKVSLIPPIAALYGPIWLGSVFQFIIRYLREGSAGTGTMSLFPGTEQLKAFTGEPILSLGFVLNRLHEHGSYFLCSH